MEPVRGRLGDHTGMGTQKITKKSLFQTLLLGHICDRCWHFSGHVFYMFPRPLYFHLVAPTGVPRSRFRKSLATNLVTIRSIVEKWKLCSRAGENVKIKLYRVCDSAWLAIFVCMFRFTTCCMYFIHHFLTFITFVSPLGLHLWPKIAISLSRVFQWFFMKLSDWPPHRAKGICDTSKIRGELGSIWEASGMHRGASTSIYKYLEASGRHLGGIWEASGKHPP